MNQTLSHCHYLLKNMLSIFSVLLVLMYASPSYAFPSGGDEIMFGDSDSIVSDTELSDIRGGFQTSSGMVVDIGLVTHTMVDGLTVAHQQVNIDPTNVQDVELLQNLVVVDATSVTVSKLPINSIAQISTVVQNTRNNVVIDNITSLNIDVTNVSRFSVQTQLPLFNHQLIGALD